MKPVFNEPVFQKLYEQKHPFFVALAWAMQQERSDLEIIYANDHNNQLQAKKRHKQWEDFAENLIERLAKLGEYSTELRGQLEQLKQQQLEALWIANKIKSAEAIMNHALWQNEADEIWERHFTWSKRRVAIQIRKNLSLDVDFDWISRVIKQKTSD